MPSWTLFEEQPEDYRRKMLGPGTVKVAIEAAVREGWDRYIGSELLGAENGSGGGAFIGMHSFGASGAIQGRLCQVRYYGGCGGRCSEETFEIEQYEWVTGSRTRVRSLASHDREIGMAIRVAINGFGRIGRLVLRAIVELGRRDIEVVAVNDLGPVETNAHLLRYDSVHGRFPAQVSVDGEFMIAAGHKMKVTAIKNPAELPHKELDVDIALECTGIFTSKDKASAHLAAGAKRVLVSAPCDSADLTVVYGVNHDKLTRDHLVVSNASCTTNCLVPVAKVLNDAVGIEHGMMTTIHSYTNDQPTLDQLHKDLYRARAAALSMIPTSTGAAKAVGLVLPELKGKLDGISVRVPTPNVSLVDLKFVARRATSVQEINDAIKGAAAGPLKGILEVVHDKLVSVDFNHHPASSSFRAGPDQGDGRHLRVGDELVRQ